jgi:pyruvate/2-oxoglutarate dehydrogenase complex dihydrolipoamide dehydrogenase (E3) component
MSGYDYDVLVIGGGGSGGFTAATTALKSGRKVGMIEGGRLGGLCILAGCMPSKALIHGADELRGRDEPPRRAYPRVLAHKRRVVEELAGRREKATRSKESDGLEVIDGWARFVDPHTVEVDGRRLSAASFVIATGSTEMIPPVPGLEKAGYLLSERFMDLEELPASMIVLGGGTMAMELSQYLVRMGVETHLIQRSRHVLSDEEPQVGETLEASLAEEGCHIYTGTELREVAAGPRGKTARFDHLGRAAEATGAEILVCLGRRANSGGLNLEAAGVETGPQGEVKADWELRTTQPHIFAAGDVTGWNMVVNLAVVQGEAAGHNATSDRPKSLEGLVLPFAVFTDPEFARVGKNRPQCEAEGLEFVEVEQRLEEMGPAITYPGRLRGFMKMRAAPESGRILGAELVAPHASLMIHDVALAMHLGAGPGAIAELAYIHPCLAEIVNNCAHSLARRI